MIIRKAKTNDIEAIHLLGVSILELKVSNMTEFMSYDEVYHMTSNRDGELFVAEHDDKIIGFCYGLLDRTNGVLDGKACIVYIAVAELHRHQGIANKLYESVVDSLKQREARYLYSWANPDSDIMNFFQKQKMQIGESRIWFDMLL
jgi:N-acetylglutamate synthase-like GNAT family acetyltransferase